MICSWCHEPTSQQPCAHCGREPMLDGRFRLSEMLGSGAAGQTWKAESIQEDGQLVAIKELTYRRLTDYKQLELFEREAKVLESLDHPGIPRYFEDFTIEEDRHVSFYLVQELIDGEALTLAAPTDEATVLQMMGEVIEILRYLSARRPPVIHRDIKPSNIMRRSDGSYVLIDFGSTRAALDVTVGQHTVAGSLGYMAPEQLMGRATPASDVYGLAATAVALLAGTSAGELINPHEPGTWKKRLTISDWLATLLEEMLEVDPALRLSDLDTILERIQLAGASTALIPVGAHALASTAEGGTLQASEKPAARRSALPVYLGALLVVLIVPVGMVMAVEVNWRSVAVDVHPESVAGATFLEHKPRRTSKTAEFSGWVQNTSDSEWTDIEITAYGLDKSGRRVADSRVSLPFFRGGSVLPGDEVALKQTLYRSGIYRVQLHVTAKTNPVTAAEKEVVRVFRGFRHVALLKRTAGENEYELFVENRGRFRTRGHWAIEAIDADGNVINNTSFWVSPTTPPLRPGEVRKWDRRIEMDGAEKLRALKK